MKRSRPHSRGAAGVAFLTRSRPRHGMEGLGRTLTLAGEVLEGLGYGKQGLSLIQTDDPDALHERLSTLTLASAAARPSTYLPAGGKRELQVSALRELHAAAPNQVEVIGFSLQAGFGRVQVDVANCTLCLACVSVCPTSALRDDPEKPALRFDEALCPMRSVQGDLPGESHRARAPDIVCCLRRTACHSQGGRAVLLFGLRQAFWHQEHNREGDCQAPGQALDVRRR